MIVTPEEAEEMWCPFARVVIAPALPSGNRIAEGLGSGALHPQGACIHEHCMAWRWVYKPVGYGEKPPAPTHGFCGLASTVDP